MDSVTIIEHYKNKQEQSQSLNIIKINNEQ